MGFEPGPCPCEPIPLEYEVRKQQKKRKHFMMNISRTTVQNRMKFGAPEQWRLREWTIKLTDFNIDSFGTFENYEIGEFKRPFSDPEVKSLSI